MNVKELIEELSKLPESYDVQIHLYPIPEENVPLDPNQEPMAISEFISGADANHEDKLAYVFGCALPETDMPAWSHGNN